MPEPSNPSLGSPSSDTAPAPRKMLRLNKAGWIIKSLASLFVFAFLCAYARTYLRYGTPRTQTSISVTRPITISRTPAPLPVHYRISHRRQAFFRPVHQVRRHTRRSSPYYLASMRRLRRLFSQLLFVRS
jgi:hypothetical protein